MSTRNLDSADQTGVNLTISNRYPVHMRLDPLNIAQYLPRLAALRSEQEAVVVSRRCGAKLHYRSISFAELEALSNRYANGLTHAGIRRGARTLLMVRQGFDFVALVFALF